MIESGLPLQIETVDALVPGATAFLAAVLLFGAVAVAFRAVDYLAATKLDRLLLAVAYAAGLVGYVVTDDLALVFAPPAVTLAWVLAGRFAGESAVVHQRPPGGTPGDGGGATDRSGGDRPDDDDSALSPDELNTDPPGHDFSDVGGMDELKATLHDRVIDPLTRTDVYDYYGIGAVNGVLFHGPPGCGKTFVASALAAETGYNYVEVTPSDVTSKYIGEAADNVATVFETARENEPCLVFIDEIDAIASDRSGRMANSEQQMVNQLLTELEGQDDDDVVVFAATNYLDDVDDAVLRSGRFDERVEVPPPDRQARLEVLQLELADAPVDDHVSLEAIADATAGYASSDVTLVADVAIRHAIGDESPVEQRHLQRAVEEIETSIPTWLDRYEDRFDEDLGRSSSDDPSPFADLPGMDEVQSALTSRVLQPVRNPDGYERLGVDPVAGALLHGPPDAGKTTLARAIAAELDRPVVEISPDRFRREDVDDPADRAAEIVEDARELAPSVLVLDDLDELTPASGGGRATGRLAARLASLLPTLDDGVLVVGTARSIDRVNVDVLHAGAFDERVEVPPPTAETRTAILAASIPDGFLDDVDFEAVADATAGYSVGDLRHLAGRVARQAVRRDAPVTTDQLVTEAASIEATLDGWEQPGLGPLSSSLAPDGTGRPR